MIPRASEGLRHLALKLALSIAPETSTRFAAANAGMVAMLLQCLAQDYERAAQNRMQDIEELQALFDARLASAEAPLAVRLREFRARRAESLALRHLDELHREGLQLLITLHARVEEAGDTAAEREIWSFLERHAARNAFELGI